MANETEQRVVELQFNNRQFEANVSQTLKTLESLKDSLKFEGAEKGFKDLDAAASKLDLSRLESNVERIANRFTILGEATDLVRRRIVGFTDQLVSTTASTLTSFSAVANLGNAWDQYAEKTSSVQTIMAATRQEFAETGNQMEIVESELDKLTWFTDETSHKFLDLVNNIGKFTSNNIGLHSAVDEMMGIATWASISGANTTEAARAMYNLSQAMSMGALTLNDWKSIENANMATVEFKQTAIDTAVELGTLTKVMDGVYQATNGAEVTIENFRETLTDSKWLNNNVLEATLTKYGGFATKLNALYENLNASGTVYTSTLLDMIEAQKNGADYTDAFNEVLEATGVSAEALRGAIETLASEENDLGYRAFKASQETKTFGEAIDYVRTAVTSGWAQSFETIFGNYEEAKALWTGFADTLYDIFVQSGETRNAILDLWKAAGGRDALFGTEEMTGILQNLSAAFETIIGPAKAAWENIFPPLSLRDAAAYLLGFTEWLRSLTEQFGLSEEAGRGLEIVLTGLLSPLKLVVFLLKLAAVAAGWLLAGIGWLADRVLSFVAAVHDGTISLKDFIAGSTAAKVALALLGFAAGLALSPIIALGYGLLKLLEYASNFSSFGDWINQMREANPVINALVSIIEVLIGSITRIPATLRNAASSFVDFISQFDSWGDLLKALPAAFVSLGLNIVAGLANGIGQGISWATSSVVNLFNAVKEAFMNVAGIHSPSVVMIALGIMIAVGLAIGILGGIAGVIAAGASLGDAIISGFSGANVAGTLEGMGGGIIAIAKGIVIALLAIPYATYLGIKALADFIASTDTFKNSMNSTEGVISRIRSTLASFFSMLLQNGAKAFSQLKSFLEPVNGFFKRFFDNLTTGQIVTMAIVAAFFMLSRSFSKVLDGFGGIGNAVTKLIKSCSGLVDSLAGVPKAFAAFKKAQAFKSYAISIGILAGSLVILAGACSEDNMDNVIRAGVALGVLAGGILVFSAIMASINKISDTMPKFSWSILALCAAIAMLSATFKSMQGIETTTDGVISFFFVCFTMCAILIAIDNMADNALSGGWSMLALALSVRTLCKTFISLSQEVQSFGSGEDLLKAIGTFTAICFALGGLMVAMAQVDVKSGIGALAGIIALKIVVNIIRDLTESLKGITANDAWADFAKLLPTIISIGVLLLVVGGALKLAGNALLGAGVGLIAGIIAIRMALSMFADMTEEELQRAMPGVAMLGSFLKDLLIGMGVITAIAGVLSIFGATFKGLGQAFISMSIALAILVGCMKMMEGLDQSTIGEFAIILTAMMVVMGISVALAGLGTKAQKGINAVRNFIIAFVACIALLSLFQTKDGNELMMPIIAMVSGLLSLAVALFAVSNITKKVKVGPIITMIVGVGIIGATLVGLSMLPFDNVLAAAGALAAGILSLAAGLMAASNITKKVKIAPIITMVASVAVLGGVIAGLSLLPWDNIVASSIAISVAMLAFAGVVRILGGLGSDATAAVIGAAAMTILAINVLGLALALQMLNGLDIAGIIVSAIALSAMLAVMGGICYLLSSMGANAIAALLGAVAMTMLAVDLMIMAAALSMLSSLDMSSMVASAVTLAILLAEMAIIVSILGAIGPMLAMAILGAVAMTVLAADMVIMAVALSMLNGLDMAALTTSAIALGALILELAVIVGVLSLLGPMLALAIAGALAMTILAADLIIVAMALSMLNSLDMETMTQSAIALAIVMGAMTAVVAVLSLLGTLAPMAIAGALAMTILAADLVIVATALSMLNTLDMETMTQSAIALGIVMAAMVGIVTVLGLIGTLSAAALVGAVALTILSADLVIIATALATVGAYDPATIQLAAETMLGTITALVGVSLLLAVVSPAALVGATTLIAMAFALGQIGQACVTFATDTATIDQDVQRVVDAITNLGNIEAEGPTKAAQGIEAISDAISQAIDDMVNVITPKMQAAGGYFVTGLTTGISMAAAAVYSSGYGLGDNLYAGVADRLIINSPSAVGQWLGQMFGLGTAQGTASMASANYSAGAIDGASAAQGAASMASANETAGQLDGASVAVGVNSQQGAAYGAGGNVGYQAAAGANAQTPAAASAGNNLGSSLWNAFMSWVNKIKAGLQKLGAALSGTEIGQKALEEVNKVTSAFNSIGDGGSGLSGFVQGAKSALEGLAKDVLNTDDLFSGLADTINNMPTGGGGGAPGGGGGSGGGKGGGGGSSSAAEEEEDAAANLIVTLDELNDKEKIFANKVKDTTEALHKGAISQDEWNASIEGSLDGMKIESNWLADLVNRFHEGSISTDEFNNELQEMNESMRSQTVREWVAELTAKYKDGILTMEEYNARIDKIIDKSEAETRTIEELNTALQNGTIKLDEYNKARAALANQAAAEAQAARAFVLKSQIDLLTDAYNKGELSQEAYQVQVEKLLDTRDEELRSLEELNYSLQAGLISLDDYASAFGKVVSQNEKAAAQAKEAALRDAILGIGDAAEYTGNKLDSYVNKVNSAIDANARETRSVQELVKALNEGSIAPEEFAAALEKMQSQMSVDDMEALNRKIAESIADINEQYDNGQMSFDQYVRAVDAVIAQNSRETRSLDDLREAFTNGLISAEEYNKAIAALQEQNEKDKATAKETATAAQIEAIQQQFADGILTLEEYNVAIQQVMDESTKETRTVEELNKALKQGTIDSSEYAKAVADLAAQEQAANAAAQAQEVADKIEFLRGRLERNEITLEEYRNTVQKVIDETKKESRTIDDLDRALAKGTITYEQYSEAIKAIYDQEQEQIDKEFALNQRAAIYALRKEYEAGTITQAEYTHQLALLADKTKEERRSIEQLDYALAHELITNEQYIEALKTINEQEEARRKAAKEAAVTAEMQSLTDAYESGAMSLEAYNAAIQRAKEYSDRETRSVEELKRALRTGTIDVNEFSTAIKNLADQQAADRQRQIDESVKAQIHNLFLEFEQGAVSEEEYLDGVEKIITKSKRETRSLKELNYQLQNNIITYDEYNTAIQNIYEAQNDMTLSLRELAEQEKATGKRTEQWQRLLKEITLDTWGMSDALLDVSTVLRFAGTTFLGFYDMLDENGSVAEKFGITDFANEADGAIKATEKLMLDFYKMQNPTDAAIQGMTDYYELTKEQLIELGQMWGNYVETAYNAIMGNYDVFNAPSWFEKEILSPDKLLSNQDMYIEGERSFVEKMEDLAGRLDSEMWMSLYEGGSKNLEQVIAFWQMTDAELEAFNEGQERLRQYAKENAEKLAAISVMVYQDAGYDAIQAFVKSTADAVDIPTVEEQAQQIGQDIGDTVGESMADAAASKFTDDFLQISWGTLLKLFEQGVINASEACELIFAKPDEYLWTLDDYSIDESFFTEQGIKYVRAMFDGTAEEVAEAHENLVSAVTQLTPYDEDKAYYAGSKIGEYLDRGIGSAVEQYIEYAVSAVEKLADAMINKLEEKIKAAQMKLSGPGMAISYSSGLAGAFSTGSITVSEFSSAVSQMADRAAELSDKIEENTAVYNQTSSKTTNVVVNQNIDAKPEDAYIIAQETGNTVRGSLRKN